MNSWLAVHLPHEKNISLMLQDFNFVTSLVLSPFLAGLLLLGACAGQNHKIIIPPDSPVQTETETGELEIIETQNGTDKESLPEWLQRFYRGGNQAVEAMSIYQDKYIFIGKTRGTSLNALRQWVDNYAADRDFPRLAAARIENRMLAAASLYPDDEYGDYFSILIKTASDAEYPPSITEETFWIKQRVEGETEETPARDFYEFFVLISIDKTLLQNRIRELMANITPPVLPTRAQNAAINRIQQIFFEGF